MQREELERNGRKKALTIIAQSFDTDKTNC